MALCCWGLVCILGVCFFVLFYFTLLGLDCVVLGWIVSPCGRLVGVRMGKIAQPALSSLLLYLGLVCFCSVECILVVVWVGLGIGRNTRRSICPSTTTDTHTHALRRVSFIPYSISTRKSSCRSNHKLTDKRHRFSRHKYTAPLIAAGAALFSGSIYGLILGNAGVRKVLGPVTPVGGEFLSF